MPTKLELIQECRALGCKGYTTKNKQELIDMLDRLKQKRWTVYVKTGCPWCSKATRYLKLRNQHVNVIEGSRTAVNSIKHLIKNHKTFPIIFYQEKFVGGYDDLVRNF